MRVITQEYNSSRVTSHMVDEAGNVYNEMHMTWDKLDYVMADGEHVLYNGKPAIWKNGQFHITQFLMHIVSDGTPRGTKFFDAKGVEMQIPASNVSWAISADGSSIATITVQGVAVDVKGQTHNIVERKS